MKLWNRIGTVLREPHVSDGGGEVCHALGIEHSIARRSFPSVNLFRMFVQFLP